MAGMSAKQKRILEAENNAQIKKTKRLQELEAENKKLREDNKQLANIAISDELDVTIQYRESSGIHAMINTQAKAEGLSVPLYVRKLVRSKFGVG